MIKIISLFIGVFFISLAINIIFILGDIDLYYCRQAKTFKDKMVEFKKIFYSKFLPCICWNIIIWFLFCIGFIFIFAIG